MVEGLFSVARRKGRLKPKALKEGRDARSVAKAGGELGSYLHDDVDG